MDRARHPDKSAWSELGAVVVAGLAPALVAAILYLGSAARTVQWGRSGFLCVSAVEASLPPPGTSPLWSLIGRAVLGSASAGEPACLLASYSAVLGALATMATGVACLEVIRAARGPGPAVAHTPGLRDALLAGLLALSLALSRPLWEASSAADSRGLSVLLAGLFLLLCLRWRRGRALSRPAGFALGLVLGLGLTQHLLFLAIALSGLVPVLLAHATGTTSGGDVRRTAGAWAAAPAMLGLLVGLLPLSMVFLAPAAYPDGLWPTPIRGEALGYVVAGLLGEAPFDATTSVGPLLARVRLTELVRDVGWLPVVGVALALVWLVRYRVPSAGLYKGKALSGAVWFGLLVFLTGWVPGWSQAGEMRDQILIYCYLGLALAAAAGYAVTLEQAEHRRGLPLGWTAVAGVAALALLPMQQTAGRVQADRGEDAWRYAQSFVDHAGDRPVALVVGRNEPQGLLLAHEVDLTGPLWYVHRVHGAPEGLTVVTEPTAAGPEGVVAGWLANGGAASPQLWPLPPARRAGATTLEVYTAPDRAACVSALLRGDTSGAIDAVALALRKGPAVPANRELGAIACLHLGDPTSALQVADRARYDHPERWQAWEVRSWALRALGRAEEAEESRRVARGLSRSMRDVNGVATLCALAVPVDPEEVQGQAGTHTAP